MMRCVGAVANERAREMKVALIQCQSQTDAMSANVAHHVEMLQRLESHGVDLVAFAELSLCHYDPVTASASPITQSWAPLQSLQEMSTALNATVVVGAAVDINLPKPVIGSLIFSPDKPMRVMGKRHLHEDELPYFSPFPGDVTVLELERRVGLAVCYELSIPAHTNALVQSDVALYVACVAKTTAGVVNATAHLKQIALQHKMPTFMVNGLGDYEGTASGGGTMAMNATGECVARLTATEEGILLIDTASWVAQTVW